MMSMLTPMAMQRVTLYVLRDDLATVGLALGEYGVFEPRSEVAESPKELPDDPGEGYRKIYQEARVRYEKIRDHFETLPSRRSPAGPEAVVLDRLARLNEDLGKVWRDCGRWEEICRRLDRQRSRIEQLRQLLEKYQALDVDLTLLHARLRFLDVQVGSVARDDVARLREAVKLTGYDLQVFWQAGDTVFLVLAGLKEHRDALRKVLSAASFHPLEVPPEFRERPTELRAHLDARARRLETDRRRMDRSWAIARERNQPLIDEAAEALALAAPCAEVGPAARHRGTLMRVSGWVPRDLVPQLRERLRARLATRFYLEARDPRPDEFSSVPSLVRHPRLLRPFAMLVRNYGVPRYGELDPTSLLAVTYLLMFGMMFGDVGHGLVIAAAGAVLRPRLHGFAPIFVAAGLTSTLFGILYGSVFGSEAVIEPLWLAPMSDPTRMLRLALYWGVGLILLSTGLAIYNHWVAGEREQALVSGEGVAGAAVYIAGVFAGYRWLSGEGLDWWTWTGGIVPLVVLARYEWNRSAESQGEALLTVPIRILETLIRYGSNTLSFLRVAAFAFNHAALAIAVFAVADMVGPVPHWFVAILGNLVILVLEGGIVAIQALRLEYYESFSRFFAGDGRAFRPLRLALPSSL